MKKLIPILGLAAVIGYAAQANAIEFDEGIFHYATINDVDNDVMVSLTSGAVVPDDVVIPTDVSHDGKTYTVTHLAGWMFQNKPIKSVKLPEKMTTFEWAVFENCTNLTAIELPSSLKWIGNYCFNECTNLAEIIIPDGVTYIGDKAFQACKALNNGQELRIPDSVNTLGTNAFAIEVPISKLILGSGITEIPTGLCAWDKNLKEVIISNNIETINSWAFQGCPLTSINLCATKTIKSNVFESCGSLTKVEVETTIPPTCDEPAFPDATYEGTLIVPEDDCIAAYRAHSVWGKFKTIQSAVPTAVDEINAQLTEDSPVYNIYGIKVADDLQSITTPGLYICNSKKILIK